ncbi:MFS transporter [Dyella solisilvae]|uniref:MFS transporter n=1 Tax=Dyella solisilvae TaxID=1920168 RepID=A0A370KC03_9GAMM|nr:MFS transporter [Dyella solisilvae]RDJ00130.1 MFS transporter [Dyella solisilvae]
MHDSSGDASAATAFSRTEIFAALLLGCVALMMLGLQPVLLGELVNRQRISLEGVGVVAMGEIFALGLGVILAEKVLPLGRLRETAAGASLLLAGVNLLTLLAKGDLACTLVRLLAGLLAAALFWITTMVIVRSAKPDRLAGVFLTLQTAVQAVVALCLARWVMPAFGWQAGFVAVAALSLLPLTVLRWIPLRLGLHAEAVKPSLVSMRGLFALLVPFAQMCAVGTLWAYLDPLGQAAGFTASNAQALVSLVLFMQLVGGSVASMAVRWWRAPATLAVGVVLFVAVTLGMHGLPAGRLVAFAVLCGVFGFGWLFLMPFHIRLAFDVDPQGRVALLVPAAQLLGSAFGPLTASFSVNGDQVGHVPLVASGFALLVGLSLLALRLRVPASTLRPSGAGQE